MVGTRRFTMAACFVLLLAALPGVRAEEGKIIREKVHGPALEKNPAGESADRWVSVYLPPSYDRAPKKRYPVLYLLHGIGDTDEMWMEKKEAYANIKDLMDRGIAEGRFGEMLVVMPDERTEWFGSFYVN